MRKKRLTLSPFCIWLFRVRKSPTKASAQWNSSSRRAFGSLVGFFNSILHRVPFSLHILCFLWCTETLQLDVISWWGQKQFSHIFYKSFLTFLSVEIVCTSCTQSGQPRFESANVDKYIQMNIYKMLTKYKYHKTLQDVGVVLINLYIDKI